MITEDDRRRIECLQSDARATAGKICSANVNAWRVGVSFRYTEGESHWSLSLQLLDGTRSIEEDWGDLGRIVAIVGAPSEPLVPIKDTPPDAVHHFQWFESPNGPVSLAGKISPETLRRIAARPTAIHRGVNPDAPTRVGRNDPCSCGSGKKYKRCCLPNEKPTDFAPCVVCHQQGRGQTDCALCAKRYSFCSAHAADVAQAMHGHHLRVHPESVPWAVEKIVSDKESLATIREQAERNPELWAKLVAYIAERQN